MSEMTPVKQDDPRMIAAMQAALYGHEARQHNGGVCWECCVLRLLDTLDARDEDMRALGEWLLHSLAGRLTPEERAVLPAMVAKMLPPEAHADGGLAQRG